MPDIQKILDIILIIKTSIRVVFLDLWFSNGSLLLLLHRHIRTFKKKEPIKRILKDDLFLAFLNDTPFDLHDISENKFLHSSFSWNLLSPNGLRKLNRNAHSQKGKYFLQKI